MSKVVVNAHSADLTVQLESTLGATKFCDSRKCFLSIVPKSNQDGQRAGGVGTLPQLFRCSVGHDLAAIGKLDTSDFGPLATESAHWTERALGAEQRDWLRGLEPTGSRAGLATVIGRYYAMDRDHRWDRIEKWYHSVVDGTGPSTKDPLQLIVESYARGETDEFVKPTVIGSGARIADGDAASPREAYAPFELMARDSSASI